MADSTLARGYSLLRSRTFWTIVVMCGATVVDQLKPFLQPDQLALLTTGLSVVAAYFHLQTGKSTTGSN